jgi:hypothetical protein
MGKPSVATIYAPTVFGKVPCLLYKETDDVNDPILVSVGSFMDTDTRRIVAKRIILSGHPYKIHKRSAVIRFMFFNSGKLKKKEKEGPNIYSPRPLLTLLPFSQRMSIGLSPCN